MPPIPATLLTRLQLAALGVLFATSVALPWLAIRYGEEAVVLDHRPDAFWITAPQPPSRAKPIPIHRDRPPTLRFERKFAVDAMPDRVELHVRALRRWTLTVNGEPATPEPDGAVSWKRSRVVEITPLLRRGPNLLHIDVQNPSGPPMLQTWSPDLPDALGSGQGWQLVRDSQRTPAVVAHDVREYPDAARLPNPLAVLAYRWLALSLVFLLCAAPVALRLEAPPWLGGGSWPRTALAVMGLFWLALYVRKALGLPVALGFDADAHIQYMRFILEQGRIPRADEGWEAFHPPLYYCLGAALRWLSGAEPGSVLDRGLLRVGPVASGLAGAWLAGRTARRIWPERPGVAALAVLAAGLLPMNVYMSVFVSNEPVHTALVAAGVFLGCDALVAPRADARRLALLSAVLGLALVTKSTTSLPVAALFVFGVGAKLWLVEGRRPLRAAGITAALLTGPLVLAGWFYLRNLLLFGDPFVSNLDAYETRTYWMPPGFHTVEWLSGFGEVFTRPFFSSFHSYWDGFYSSFWGDGYASGRAGVLFPNPWWDYETMAAIYPLAAPASAILVLGLGVCVWESLRGPQLGRRMALSLLVAIAVGMLLMTFLATLRIPINAMPKAFYTLPALVPFALAFAAGTTWLWDRAAGRWGRPFRAALAGTLGLLALTIATAFLR
jgi:hypothetical protein